MKLPATAIELDVHPDDQLIGTTDFADVEDGYDIETG